MDRQQSPMSRTLVNSGLRVGLVVVLLAAGSLLSCTAIQPGPTPTLTPAATHPPSPTAQLSTVLTATPPPTADPSPTPAPTPGDPVETQARHLRIFTELWELVDQTYLYPDYNGADWPAIGEQYRARIEAGLSDEQFWAAMAEMLEELNDDHSQFLSPAEVARENQVASGDFDYVGVGITATPLPEKGYTVILTVRPDGPADRAGLRPHDHLLSVDGIPVCCEGDQDTAYRLRGPEGSTVEVLVQTPGEEPRTVTITRARIQAAPPIEFRRLEAGIGYIMLPDFMDITTVSQVRQILQDLAVEGEIQGLIIDLRINTGGLRMLMHGLLAFFTDGEVGHSLTRWSELPQRVQGEDVAGSSHVPLVILVSSWTESSAEIFSGVLQEAGRARIVGGTTAGNAEVVYMHNFEDGSRAWIAQESFRSLGGANWEGIGIVPDVEIPLDWDEFSVEEDPQLDAALELLRE